MYGKAELFQDWGRIESNKILAVQPGRLSQQLLNRDTLPFNVHVVFVAPVDALGHNLSCGMGHG